MSAVVEKRHYDAADRHRETYSPNGLNRDHLAQSFADFEVKDRGAAIKWANRSVSQDAFFPVADALRELEAYLRNTPHHNVPEAAMARKVLAAFDGAKS